MEVQVAKYGDSIAVAMPANEEAARAAVESLCAVHGDGAVLIDGVSVAQLKAQAAEQAEKERLAAEDAAKKKADAEAAAAAEQARLDAEAAEAAKFAGAAVDGGAQ